MCFQAPAMCSAEPECIQSCRIHAGLYSWAERIEESELPGEPNAVIAVKEANSVYAGGPCL